MNKHIRGPIGASWVYLSEWNACWKAPFVISLLGHDVNVLEVPPIQVRKILMEHVRIQLDRRLIEKVICDENLTRNEVTMRYQHGIDWPLVRQVLRGKANPMPPHLRWALQLLVTDAFWSDERRWLGGYLGIGVCTGCYLQTGTTSHKITQCEAMKADMMFENLAGRHRAPRDVLADPSLGPLLVRGLPPKIKGWSPVEICMTQGALRRGVDGDTYGDGSGYRGKAQHDCTATWSCARIRYDHMQQDATTMEQVSGNVPGWMQTVPRAEISAYVHFLETALIPARYVGDCKHVIDVAALGGAS